ncbi:MAG TPA: hypothetical protein VGC21_02905 [Telluria sp.]
MTLRARLRLGPLRCPQCGTQFVLGPSSGVKLLLAVVGQLLLYWFLYLALFGGPVWPLFALIFGTLPVSLLALLYGPVIKKK